MSASMMVVFNAVMSFWFGFGGAQGGVAHFAHLGGMLGGWLAIQYRRRGFPFARRR